MRLEDARGRKWEGAKRGDSGRDPFNQNFRKFRSKTQWIGSVQPEKFRKNGSTIWGGPLFPFRTGWNFGWMDRALSLSRSSFSLFFPIVPFAEIP